MSKEAAAQRTGPGTGRSERPGPEGVPERAAGGGRPGTATAVVGLQWGDEGKGKLVHLLADRHDVVVRYNGGANAGHSIVVNGERFALHLIPSGILHAGKPSVVGNGVVVDPEWLLKEVEGLRQRGVECSGLVISSRAHAVMPWHKAEDEAYESLLRAGTTEAIGTTRRGIGPCYADKALRALAVRIGDLLRPEALEPRLRTICAVKNGVLAALHAQAGGAGPSPVFDAEQVGAQARQWGERLRPFVRDTSALLLEALAQGKRVLFEGANATLLDVDHGTYPFVTASGTAATGIASGAGVPPSCLGRVIGVMKAYSTRVGGGPMPTELAGDDRQRELGERIRQRGREFGTTTGRPRRVGWLDLAAVRYAVRLNGATDLSLMLLDVLAGIGELRVGVGYRLRGRETALFPSEAADLAEASPVYRTLPGWAEDLSGCRRLEDLPAQARAYVDLIEEFCGVPVRFISVGPDRSQTIER